MILAEQSERIRASCPHSSPDRRPSPLSVRALSMAAVATQKATTDNDKRFSKLDAEIEAANKAKLEAGECDDSGQTHGGEVKIRSCAPTLLSPLPSLELLQL